MHAYDAFHYRTACYVKLTQCVYFIVYRNRSQSYVKGNNLIFIYIIIQTAMHIYWRYLGDFIKFRVFSFRWFTGYSSKVSSKVGHSMRIAVNVNRIVKYL